MLTLKNPIISGSYPDPSICRVDDSYYMVCSSFEMYPGIPIFHSKNLAEWTQIGHALTKDNGFHVVPNSMTGGVMAPTIRYSDGTFYIMNANMSDKGNFIVTATDPRGPWSPPIWLDDIPGIDASLFIDHDGSAYVLGTGNVVERADGKMDRGIYICPFDLETMKPTGESKTIWDSALRVASSPEAPHLYKKNDYYYLVIAEGGTEHYHAVSVARSKVIDDWYEANPANPIMTHRQFGYSSEISNVGHADFVDTPNGNWYSVLLGSRTIDGYYKNLGRETFLCPVTWEKDWPYLSAETGKVEWTYDLEEFYSERTVADQSKMIAIDMASESLPQEIVLWGTPYKEVYQFKDNAIILPCHKRGVSEPIRWALDQEKNKSKTEVVSFLGVRQKEPQVQFETEVYFSPKNQETAGMLIMQASNHQFKAQLCNRDRQICLELVQVTTDMNVPPHIPTFKGKTTEKLLVTIPLESADIRLKVSVDYQKIAIFYQIEGESWELLKEVDGRIINPEIVGCMAGTQIGIFASGNGEESANSAVFRKFVYETKDSYTHEKSFDEAFVDSHVYV